MFLTFLSLLILVAIVSPRPDGKPTMHRSRNGILFALLPVRVLVVLVVAGMEYFTESEPERRTKIRSSFHPVFHPDGAAVALDQSADDEEAEAVAVPPDPFPLEPAEDRFFHAIGYTRPGILNRDQHALAVVGLHPDGDPDVLAAELDGVPDEVREDLGEQVVRPDPGEGAPCNLDRDLRECGDLFPDDGME